MSAEQVFVNILLEIAPTSQKFSDTDILYIQHYESEM
jgi:hypothetical protein